MTGRQIPSWIRVAGSGSSPGRIACARLRRVKPSSSMPSLPSKYASQTLRNVEFEGLFGTLDRRIDLERTAPTIITGANGTGKSTILRLINAAANGSIGTLVAAPVKHFRLIFDKGPDFVLERDASEIKISWGVESASYGSDDGIFAQLPAWAVEALETLDPDEDGFSRDLMEIARANGAPVGEYYRVREALEQGQGQGLQSRLRAPEWLARFGQGFPVLFVADQRLITEPTSVRLSKGARHGRSTRLAIEAASQDLSDRLRNADSDYARSSQIADSKLAEALIERMTAGGDVPVSTVRNLIQSVDARRDILQAVGLLDESSSAGVSVNEAQLSDAAVRRVVQVVLESTMQKFAVLEDLEQRLTAFKTFIDGRLGGKTLLLDRRSGLQFSLANGGTVRPRQLSSGEQQVTVLAYEILFRSRPSTLLIVDEPEISLHISWQDSLVDDLSQMGRAADVRFLLATHSPMILAGHPGLERSLSAKYDDA